MSATKYGTSTTKWPTAVKRPPNTPRPAPAAIAEAESGPGLRAPEGVIRAVSTKALLSLPITGNPTLVCGTVYQPLEA
ncbi:MAG: hypothetical protein GSR73_03075 [Desulfurococcales archaeon]|nr:hypothetical protein [Desulfurococcales archaeon]